MPKKSSITEAEVDLIVKLRDEDGMSWPKIGRIINKGHHANAFREYIKRTDYERYLYSYRGTGSKKYTDSELYAQEFEGAAEYRQAFKLVFGTSKLQEYAA